MTLDPKPFENPFQPPREAQRIAQPAALALLWGTVGLAILLLVALPDLPARLPSPLPRFTLPVLSTLIAVAAAFGTYRTLGGLSVFTSLADPVMFSALLLLDWRGYAAAVTLAEVLIFVSEKSRRVHPTAWYVRVFNVAVYVVAGAAALGFLTLADPMRLAQPPLWGSPLPALLLLAGALTWKAVSVWTCTALMTLAARRPLARALADFSARAFFAELVVFIIAIPFAVAWQVNVWVALLTLASLGVASRLLGVPELEYRAATDARTGLANVAQFEERLAAAVDAAAQRGQAFALISLDIDFFKQINDRYGHPVGDGVIVHLARILTASVRPGDVVARTGGEEFSILLLEGEASNAPALAERLRGEIAAEPYISAELEGPVRFTASFGVAMFPRDGNTVAKLKSAADAALYRAKAAGRNAVRDATEAASGS